MAIYNSVLDTIGRTPLVRLNKVTEGLQAEVLVKLEFFNPLSSVKDRIGRAMVDAAERDGRLKPGGTIVRRTPRPPPPPRRRDRPHPRREGHARRHRARDADPR